MTQKFKLLFKAAYAFAFFVLLVGCQKDISPSENNSEENIVLSSHPNDNGTIVQTTTFSATAAIAYCWGENINFGGTIHEKVHKSTDGQGNVHYVRSFTAKDMTGVGATSGMTYDVVGGNEMFSIKNPVMSSNPLYPAVPASIANADILIHQGILVFVRSDGERVIARHVIRKTPRQGVAVNQWFCNGN
jgi:hypothetical protein